MSIVEEQNNSTIVENTMHEKISNPHSSRWILIIGIIASIFTIAIIGTYTLYKILGIGDVGPLRLSSIKPLYQTPTQTQEVNETANWKIYTYKNMSFHYPNHWTVVFDSAVADQPNGFLLHVQDKNASGYQPDGLYLSTFNDRQSLEENQGYIFNPERKFVKTERGDGYIQFEVNSTPIYAGCAFYKDVQDTIRICNQILSTFRFEDLTTSKFFDQNQKQNDNARNVCISAGGKWLKDYNECESSASDKGLDQKSCAQLGGSYNECASACRHNPEAEVCTTVCVKVCKFK